MNGQDIPILETDVLIIGGGAAGCSAALAADDHRARVLILAKGAFGRCGNTNLANVACSAAFGDADPRDTPSVHMRDTVHFGRYLGNQELIRIMCEGAPAAVRRVEQYGMPWYKLPDGRYNQARSPDHTYDRGCHYDQKTGRMLQWALLRELLHRPGIQVVDDLLVTHLLTDDRGVIGALALDVKRGTPVAVGARQIILATGGSAMMYRVNDVEHGTTGDGLALAYRAGAELISMEFHQFYPTAFTSPESLRGILVSTAMLWKLGLKLINADGDRFMARYYPDRLEGVARDELSRCIFQEIREGRGTPHGGVWLDTGDIADWEHVRRERPRSYVWPERFGVDTRRFEVAPTYHFTMGGVRFDRLGRSTVPGLLVAGEVAGGVHGANRIAGNALAECLVFGAIAGETAANFLTLSLRKPSTAQLADYWQEVVTLPGRDSDASLRPVPLRRRLQGLMYEHAGILRDELGLNMALTGLAALREEQSRTSVSMGGVFNLEWIEAIENGFLIDVAEMTVHSALLRRESRGAHNRTDYPATDDANWLRVTICHRGKNGAPILGSEPVATPFVPHLAASPSARV